MARRVTLAFLLGTTAFVASAAAAQAAPVWSITAMHGPSSFQPGGEGEFTFFVGNMGDSSASGPVQMTIDLPAGTETKFHPTGFFAEEQTWANPPIPTGWDCGPSVAGQTTLTCNALVDPVTPGANGFLGYVKVYVEVAPDATGPLKAIATVSGGGAEVASVEEVAPVAAPIEAFGFTPGSLMADAFDTEGVPERQGGRHPHRVAVEFEFNAERVEVEHSLTGTTVPVLRPIEEVRSVEVRAPRGLVGNPNAVPLCTAEPAACSPETQVGVIHVGIRNALLNGLQPSHARQPVYNMAPPRGYLADFAFEVAGRRIDIRAKLDPRDYSVVTVTPNIQSTLPVQFQKLTLWGVPGKPVHQTERLQYLPPFGFEEWNTPFEGEVKPFLSLPTECGARDSTELLRLNSWEQPGRNAASGERSEPAEVNGCDQLEFPATIEARPSTNLADAPSGFEFEMTIPQNEDPDGLATAHLRDAVVTLPEGMTVNPPSADGLGACSMEQVGIGVDAVPSGAPVRCPDASKLGSVEAESPAVDHPLKGSVYLAEQNQNPFGSLLAMYLVIEDLETGVLVKLPGKVDADPVTGQLTATFKNNPQLPVENLRLKFFEGPRAALKTPSTCGTYETTGTLTPWSAPEAPSAEVSSSFELTQGPGGGACLPGGGSAPNQPAFNAGTQDPTAKAFTPFGLKLTRADGTQQIRSIDTVLPKGLTARLAGTTYCPDAALAAAAGKSGEAERASASCPASSHVGSVNVGAGAGSTPLYVQGQAYLAGPYKGAPLSLAIVTPAVAGPFDLGVVVVRTALHVDPVTTQVRAVSDEIPQILQGIPLNLRSIALKLDKPSFTLNPTSCDPMSIDGSALTVFNQSAALTNHFQVGECNRLGFKPKLAIKLSGKTKRSGHPALKATLTMPEGANIRRAQVTLPKTELLEQSHIRTICTRVQYAAKSCPKAAVYGYAKAWSPLLDQPLEGPVYLRSSSNPLPDLVADLNGQIEVDLVGRIDSVNARIRNTFESVPDAPVSKFVLTMQGGKKSLLVNNTDLCKAKPKASMLFEAQNGKSYEASPAVKAECGKKGRKGKGKKRGTGKR